MVHICQTLHVTAYVAMEPECLRLTQVLDRVIAKVGGRNWWANLSGRAKAQQMWAAHQSGAKVVRHVTAHGVVLYSSVTLLNALQGDALKDLSSYSLSARGRYAFGR